MNARATVWLGEHRIGDELVARIGRRGEELIAEFPNLGTFVGSPKDGSARFEAAPDADPVALAKLSASALDALARHLQGKLTLHGAAVCYDRDGIVFVGPGGAGKSTFAAALCAGTRAAFIADDTVSIEFPSIEQQSRSIEIVPTQPAAWLLPDVRQYLGLDSTPLNKTQVAFDSPRLNKVLLRTIIALSFGPNKDPVLKQLRGQEALWRLAQSTIRLVIDDSSAHLREFEQLKNVVESCPIYELCRPRDLKQLDLSTKLVRGIFDTVYREGYRS